MRYSRVMDYQIGEFSYITRFSVKTLRFYHEQGILAPSRIDGETGYRYYDENSLKRARIIQQLKELGFSIREIKEIIDSCSSDYELVSFVQKKFNELDKQIAEFQTIKKRLKHLIVQNADERSVEERLNGSSIEEKRIEPFLITSIRFQGRYTDFGSVMSHLYKCGGRSLRGGPFTMYWDLEYKEDADIEVCAATSRVLQQREVAFTSEDDDSPRHITGMLSSRELAEEQVVSLIHKGPYTSIGDSYSLLLRYAKEHRQTISTPIRELYKKGPGIIFEGNPDNYLTEIQLIVR